MSDTVHCELQTLRREHVDTRRKLQEYADTILSLHDELRTLQDSICNSCKRKFVPVNLVVPSQVAVDSSFFVKPTKPIPRLGPEIPNVSIINVSQSLPISSTSYTPSSPPVLTTILGNETPALTSKPHTTSTSKEAIALKTLPVIPRWSAQPHAKLKVTFVRAFVHKGSVRSVRFSADGVYIAVAAVSTKGDKKGGIFIYNVETGDKHCELEEYPSQYSSTETPIINCLCFSPNGRYLVIGDAAGRVPVWDITNKRMRNVFRGHRFSVDSVDFSPDGRLVVSSSWDIVRIWNMRDDSSKVFTDDTLIFFSVRFSPNGQSIAVGNSDGIRILNVRRGQVVKKWTGYKPSARKISFMPDGMGLVIGGHSSIVTCWDVISLEMIRSGGQPVTTKDLEFEDHSSGVYAVAVSPDGQWIASGLSDKSTVIWDAHSAMHQCKLIGHTGVVSSVEFSPAGSYLALGSDDSHVSVWRYTRT